jgi:hypothetical protein
MTHITFTSGQIIDIMDALRSKAVSAINAGDDHLTAYYGDMIMQFETVFIKLNELPGELREANLVLAMN